MLDETGRPTPHYIKKRRDVRNKLSKGMKYKQEVMPTRLDFKVERDLLPLSNGTVLTCTKKVLHGDHTGAASHLTRPNQVDCSGWEQAHQLYLVKQLPRQR